MKRVEVISLSDVRNFCIKRNFYTAGTVEQYNAMFDLCTDYNNVKGDIDILESIARDIIHHSSNVSLALYDMQGDELVGAVMADLQNMCVTTIFRKE